MKKKTPKQKLKWLRINDDMRARIEQGRVVVRRTDTNDIYLSFSEIERVNNTIAAMQKLTLADRDVRVVGERIEFIRLGCQIIPCSKIAELCNAIRAQQQTVR